MLLLGVQVLLLGPETLLNNGIYHIRPLSGLQVEIQAQ